MPGAKHFRMATRTNPHEMVGRHSTAVRFHPDTTKDSLGLQNLFCMSRSWQPLRRRGILSFGTKRRASGTESIDTKRRASGIKGPLILLPSSPAQKRGLWFQVTSVAQTSNRSRSHLAQALLSYRALYSRFRAVCRLSRRLRPNKKADESGSSAPLVEICRKPRHSLFHWQLYGRLSEPGPLCR